MATDLVDEPADRPERSGLTAELQLFRELTAETVERMPLGFVALDHQLHVTYANPVALALVGPQLKEAVGRRPWELFPQIVGTRFETIRRSAAITVEYEEHFAPGDRWVGVLGCPTQAGTAVFLRDITARRRAEETVRRSVALLHGSLDAMLDAVVLCSAVRDGNDAIEGFQVEFANVVASAFLGREPDTLIGAIIPDPLPSERGLSFLATYRAVVDTGEAWSDDAVEYNVPGPDGVAKRGSLSVQIVRFGDGFLATWRDVTERQRLAAERERLAAALEQTIDGVIIADAGGNITYANAAFLATNGLALRDLVGREASIVAGEILGINRPAALEQAALAGEPWLQEFDSSAADGANRHLQVSMTPVRDAGGVVTSYVVFSRDVTALRDAESEVALQVRVGAALAETLRSIPEGGTLEQAAQAICEELLTLPFVDVATIAVFLAGGDVQVLAQGAPPGYPLLAGTYLPPARAAVVRDRCAVGPWARYAETDDGDGGLRAAAVAEGLKALAYGPILYGDRVVGYLALGTFDERLARTVVETMPGIATFSSTSSALLAERMHARRQEAELHRALTGTLGAASFRPVFQPIVDLQSGEVVGYEALTRFDSGQRPDRCLADAWSVGLGPDLELATLASAITAAKALPAGRWLNVNLSPRLLESPERLRPVLWSADRPLVVEITEHEVIQDYVAVRDAVSNLGHDIRLAVDDAGAGVANFGHIIELRPDFVKLDIGLVRRVNANLGRQALVVGMVHFSRTAGCRLVAEGVETEEEAHTLVELGVDFGQGYLFGHPEAVAKWAAPRSRPDGPGSGGRIAPGVSDQAPRRPRGRPTG